MIVNGYTSQPGIKEYAENAPLIFSVKWRVMDHFKDRYTKEDLELRINKLKLKQKRYQNGLDSFIWLTKHYFGKKVPPFSSIEIETINRCNGTCSFCPVNHNSDPRNLRKMDERLFIKIIDELKEMNYLGRIALHSNNEPFLDKRLIEFAKYAKENLPKAFLYLYTNGTLVTMDKFFEVMKYLDRIYFDNYDDDLKLSDNAIAINAYCMKNRKMNERVEIILRKQNEVLYTRGGQAPNNQKKEILKQTCILPFKQMVIRPDGKCSLCCNDALGKNTLGDVNKNTLYEIWGGDKYMKIRKSISRGRKFVSLCKYCDTLADPNVY
jgi:hypothetical protein